MIALYSFTAKSLFNSMFTTKLTLQDILPLTCTRTGTCCHGNQVFLNPWELARLAHEKGIAAVDFRSNYCDDGGVLLRFNGKVDKRGKSACSQYIDNFGCSVHVGRPLACRLFPLGRQVQNGTAEYIFQGEQFPCLNGCTAVVELPHLSVAEYLKGQETDAFEKAQDAYLEVMQNLAENAFALLLDSGLAATGETKTLSMWRELGKVDAKTLAERIGEEWLMALLLPTIDSIGNAEVFAEIHNERLQEKAQDEFGSLQAHQAFHEASLLMMSLALYLSRALGAHPESLSEHWVEEAKGFGACE
jgi:Fe-S-cluster containining protein